MAVVTISDTGSPAGYVVVNDQSHFIPPVFQVYSRFKFIEVARSETPVKVKGTDYIHIQVNLLWNGGTNNPTTKNVHPESWWGPPPYTDDKWFHSVLYDGSGKWFFKWGITGGGMPEPQLSHIKGTSFNTAVKEYETDSDAAGGTGNHQATNYGFSMRKNGSPDAILPDEGDECTLIIPTAAISGVGAGLPGDPVLKAVVTYYPPIYPT